ncbi:MAG: hypothetical protein HC853_14690, partial [Anaerolineae bacterium]|nr:hypothetical protein [Anaerolineae bacterium]
MTEFAIPVLEGQEAWAAQYRAGWLKHHQDTGEFDWKRYDKPTNTQSVSGGSVALQRSRVVLISSAGGYLRDVQMPFDAPHPYGDYSIRVFPTSTPLDQIAIAHDHYDHKFVDADRQVLLPLRHLEDLAREGVIGSVANTVISFTGYLPDAARVVDELVPQIIEAVYVEKADAAFLVARDTLGLEDRRDVLRVGDRAEGVGLGALGEGDGLADLHVDAWFRDSLAGEHGVDGFRGVGVLRIGLHARAGLGEAVIERAVIGDLVAVLLVDDEDFAFALHAELLADELKLVHQHRDVEALRLRLDRGLVARVGGVDHVE